MIGLPEFGQKVRVWPRPGRTVQDGPNPVDRWAGGRYLAEDGQEIVWSAFSLEQLRSGDILLHAPRTDDPGLKRHREHRAKLARMAKPAKFDHAHATQVHMQQVAGEEATIDPVAQAASAAAQAAEEAKALALEAARRAEEHAQLAQELAEKAKGEAAAAASQAKEAQQEASRKAKEAAAAADKAQKALSSATDDKK